MHDSHISHPARPTWAAGRQAADRSVVLGLGVVLLAGGFATYAQEQTPARSEDSAGFKVIIHGDNPTVELEADLIARIFRKKVRRWSHDVRVVPVDLKRDSPIREAFTRAVHKKSVTAIVGYWQRMIFGRGEKPPEEKATEEEVLALVRADPGAIGYVSAGKTLGDGVKELQVIP